MEPFCLPVRNCSVSAINKPVKSGLKRRMMNYFVDSYTDGEIRIPKNLLLTWIQEVWKNDITNEIIHNSFMSCGMGVSPVDSSQRIYWKERSLQSLEMLLIIDQLFNQFERTAENSLTTIRDRVQQPIRIDKNCRREYIQQNKKIQNMLLEMSSIRPP